MPLTATITVDVSTSCKQANWKYFGRTHLTCGIVKPKIDSQSVYINSPHDTKVLGFLVSNEKYVKFVPMNVAEKYPNLIAFEIYNSSLTSISRQTLSKLHSLLYFNVGGNQITMIESQAFQYQTRLELLDLARNQIEHVHSQLFNPLKSLKKLFLHDNEIQWISEDHFLGLNNLEFMNIANNEIKSLNWELFSGLSNIKNMSFSFNNIETVTFHAIIKTKMVERIWLKGNKITHLDYRMFTQMRNLKFLDLSNNTCINKSYLNTNFDEMMKDLESDLLFDRCGKLEENKFANVDTSTARKFNIFDMNAFMVVAILFELRNVLFS